MREYGDSLRGSMRVRGEIAYRGEMYHPLLRISHQNCKTLQSTFREQVLQEEGVE